MVCFWVGSLSGDGLGFRVGNGEGVGIACAGLGFGKGSLVGNFGNFVVLGNLFCFFGFASVGGWWH